MIEGKHVNLRALEKEDLEILKIWRNDRRTRIHTREYRLLNMINQYDWFESLHKQNPPSAIMFGIENKKRKLIGVCGLVYIDWKNRHAEISNIISMNKWQRTKESNEDKAKYFGIRGKAPTEYPTLPMNLPAFTKASK